MCCTLCPIKRATRGGGAEFSLGFSSTWISRRCRVHPDESQSRRQAIRSTLAARSLPVHVTARANTARTSVPIATPVAAHARCPVSQDDKHDIAAHENFPAPEIAANGPPATVTMWLDRLASQSGPPTPSSQPGSRSYSPLPVRTSSNLSPYVTSQRAGQPPRSSATSLVSSSSATSLLGAAKKPNGPGLKDSSSYRGGPAPEDTLEKLLGAKIADYSANGRVQHSITESDFELDLDFGDLSLAELAATDPSTSELEAPRRAQTVGECELRLSKSGT